MLNSYEWTTRTAIRQGVIRMAEVYGLSGFVDSHGQMWLQVPTDFPEAQAFGPTGAAIALKGQRQDIPVSWPHGNDDATEWFVAREGLSVFLPTA